MSHRLPSRRPRRLRSPEAREEAAERRVAARLLAAGRRGQRRLALRAALAALAD